ncbi:hypothetical protein ACLF3G_02670 [Falsiroseomonas sp. HC035]|uniref:hypothetical protein n=1 Tax=Falsiroseomonas sp. HC035 TaxID=3390999 RepID=UPI003D315D03
MNWLLPNGIVRPLKPENLGVIGDGHYIQLGKIPGDHTVWDESFEPEFEKADDNFPTARKWLESLGTEDRT